MGVLKRIKIKDVLDSGAVGSEVLIKGWVRFFRNNRFIVINDGSSINNIQAVADESVINAELIKKITVGASVAVTGKLVESQGSGQSVEIIASHVEVIGVADPEKYPLQPKKHSLEFLREIAHLRFRTNIFGAVTRVRHAMIFAVHEFFTKKGFVNIHTPIVTGSDCEGAGEMFRVSTLDAKNPPLKEDGSIDYSKDFFGRETNLTVSGQLEGELAALAMSDIYTFGPTFRAENSNTARHLAEFWMIEPEMAFYELTDNMDLAEEFLKYLLNYALENCIEDLQFLSKRQQEEEKNKPQDQRSMELIEKIKFVIDNDFARITYTEAIEILANSKPAKKNQFQYPIKGFGTDLQSEHERFLVEKHFKRPVILTDYPKEIKAFYMKQNQDGKTVRAMDILFPGIGEIVGGSQREESLEKLENRMKELNLPVDEMWWYMDTRRFGSVPHSGFGLGFERLMLFISGMGNIRDVIPFPRTPKNAEF
ncbi:MAG: asparagine--tRNA ligase [Bacteroidales bacterium]|nr:asparagine--tRNA ligase [Bacteroidales bacterium]MBN2820600.1 asparagine--tRNA ligase [Bacteroidales bacterium]